MNAVKSTIAIFTGKYRGVINLYYYPDWMLSCLNMSRLNYCLFELLFVWTTARGTKWVVQTNNSSNEFISCSSEPKNSSNEPKNSSSESKNSSNKIVQTRKKKFKPFLFIWTFFIFIWTILCLFEIFLCVLTISIWLYKQTNGHQDKLNLYIDDLTSWIITKLNL